METHSFPSPTRRTNYLAALLILAGPLNGCNDGGRHPEVWGSDLSRQVRSPSGRYILDIQGFAKDFDANGDQWWLAKVSIRDINGQLLFQDDTSYATWFPFRFTWTEADAVSVYSGDVGGYLYVLHDGKWAKKKVE